MPEALLPTWRGADGSLQGPTDYDRACEVQHVSGMIRLQGYDVLVLGDEPLLTTWFPAMNGKGGCLVSWGHAPDEAALLDYWRHIDKAPREGYEEHDPFFVVEYSTYVLFDSATPGNEIGSAIRISLEGPRYRVRTRDRESPDRRVRIVTRQLEAAGPAS